MSYIHNLAARLQYIEPSNLRDALKPKKNAPKKSLAEVIDRFKTEIQKASVTPKDVKDLKKIQKAIQILDTNNLKKKELSAIRYLWLLITGEAQTIALKEQKYDRADKEKRAQIEAARAKIDELNTIIEDKITEASAPGLHLFYNYQTSFSAFRKEDLPNNLPPEHQVDAFFNRIHGLSEERKNQLLTEELKALNLTEENTKRLQDDMKTALKVFTSTRNLETSVSALFRAFKDIHAKYQRDVPFNPDYYAKLAVLYSSNDKNFFKKVMISYYTENAHPTFADFTRLKKAIHNADYFQTKRERFDASLKYIFQSYLRINPNFLQDELSKYSHEVSESELIQVLRVCFNKVKDFNSYKSAILTSRNELKETFSDQDIEKIINAIINGFNEHDYLEAISVTISKIGQITGKEIVVNQDMLSPLFILTADKLFEQSQEKLLLKLFQEDVFKLPFKVQFVYTGLTNLLALLFQHSEATGIQNFLSGFKQSSPLLEEFQSSLASLDPIASIKAKIQKDVALNLIEIGDSSPSYLKKINAAVNDYVGSNSMVALSTLFDHLKEMHTQEFPDRPWDQKIADHYCSLACLIGLKNEHFIFKIISSLSLDDEHSQMRKAFMPLFLAKSSFKTNVADNQIVSRDIVPYFKNDRDIYQAIAQIKRDFSGHFKMRFARIQNDDAFKGKKFPLETVDKILEKFLLSPPTPEAYDVLANDIYDLAKSMGVKGEAEPLSYLREIILLSAFDKSPEFIARILATTTYGLFDNGYNYWFRMITNLMALTTKSQA